MKAIKHFTTLAALIVMVALQACSSTEPFDPNESDKPYVAVKIPVKFSSDAAAGTRTALGGNEWLAGDSIGIYIMNFADAIGLSIADNRLYLAETDGASHIDLNPATLSETIYYPDASSLLKFIAYYPWKPYGAGNIIDYVYPVNISHQEDTAGIDLLYSTFDGTANGTGTGVVQSSNSVDLDFNHQLSKLIINVKAEDPTDVIIPGMNVTINSMQALADFNLGTGALTPKGDQRAITMLEIPPTKTGYDAGFQAIILPHNITGPGLELIQMNTVKRQFSWDINSSVLTQFEAGMQYTFNLTLVGETVVKFTAEIVPWTDGVITTNTKPTSVSGTLSKKVILGGLDTLDVVFIHPTAPFMMGSTKTSSGDYAPSTPLHKVTLTKSFLMTQGEITNAQFAKFLNANGGSAPNSEGEIAMNITSLVSEVPSTATSLIVSCISKSSYAIGDYGVHYNSGVFSPAAGCDNNPACGVTWYGALAYARWVGGAIPTEAQWEYAARAGSTFEYVNGTDNGSGGTALSSYAWFNHTGTAPGSKTVGPPFLTNAFNLYHISGNLMEWTLDRIASSSDGYPTNQPVTDPGGTCDNAQVLNTSIAVLRGGAFNTAQNDLYLGARMSCKVNQTGTRQGFRIIFPLE